MNIRSRLRWPHFPVRRWRLLWQKFITKAKPLLSKEPFIRPKKSYWKLYAGLTFLVLMVPAVFFLVKPSPTEAAWWDTNWGFRKKMPLSNSSGSTQTDFQVQLTLDTATQVTAGKLQSDCDDLRFTDMGGKVLPYWVEPTTCNTVSTIVWVKVPSIPTSGADIYWYYGNPGASTAADTTKTFIKDQDSAMVAWPLDDTTTTQSYSRTVNQGMAQGRDIVINGGVDADATWTKGTGWTIADGVAHFSGGVAGNLTQVLPVTSGKVYELTMTVSNYSAGVVTPFLGNAGTGQSANGTVTSRIIASSTTLIIQGNGTFIGDIDNVSVRQINIPPSSGTATELLTDGNMEAAGTTAWTSNNGASLSKQTTNPYAGTQIFRVTSTGSSTPVAIQTVLTAGQVYRVTGYARSDGTANAIVRNGNSQVVSISATTTWTPFDVVFVAGTSNLFVGLGTQSSVNGQYAEFDNVTVSLDTNIRPGELLQDGTMEASGTGVWTSGSSSTLSKQTGTPHGGSQVLRVAYNGTNNPYAYQTILVTGKTYRVTGYARGDGTFAPLISGAANRWTGTSSTSWQFFDVTYIATTTSDMWLRASATSAGYAEFDDVSVTEVSPLVGLPTNGVTLGSSSGSSGHLTNAYTFDGNNDNVNIYSSDLNSVLNQNEGTLAVWAKVSGSGVWTDGTQRNIVNIQSDANNIVQIARTVTNNTLTVQYSAAGSNKTTNLTVSPTEWFQVLITWSRAKDEVKVYYNGSQSGSTLTGTGTWSGNLATTTANIGSLASSGSRPWSGMINDVRLYNRALTTEEISAQYSASSDIQAYTTANYPNKELLRKYNAGITVGAAATEEIGAGPVAYWKFDDGQGQTAQDSSSNNNDGTLGATSGSSTDDPTWITEDQCVSGKCIRVDGSNDYVSNSSNINLANNSFSTSFWMKISEDATNKAIIAQGAETIYQGFVIGLRSTNTFTFSFWGSDLNTTTTFVPNKWYHISTTYNATTNARAIYVDGVLNVSDSAGADFSGTGNLCIAGGCGPWSSNYFGGNLDDVKVYPYARSAAQVKADYNLGAAELIKKDQTFLSDGLVGYWKMDEASWTNNCSTDTVLDSSGNSSNGDACPNSTGPTGGVVGKFGNGGLFDGINDYINTQKSFTTTWQNSYAISFWMKPTDGQPSSFQTILGNSESVPNIIRVALNTSGTVYADYTTTAGSAIALTNSAVFSDGAATNWTHVVVVGNNTVNGVGGLKIYVNGQEAVLSSSNNGSTANIPFSSYTGVNPVFIGARDSGSASQFYGGYLDDVRFYSKLLSLDEIQSLYDYAPGPVAHWKLDESTGTTTVDSSGNGYNGTFTNSPTWTEGKYGGALNFEKTEDDYVDISTASLGSVVTKNGNFTAEAWVKITTSATGTGQIFEFSNSGSDRNGLIVASNGRVGGGYYDGSAYVMVTTSPSTISSNTWYHVAYTNQGGTLTLYINGTQKFTTDAGGVGGSLTASKRIGWGGTSSVIQVDDVRVYNYVRTQQQIVQDMGGDPAPSLGGNVLPEPVAHYKLNEQNGQAVNNSGVGGSTLNGTFGANSGSSTDDPTWKTKADCKQNGCASFDGADYVGCADATCGGADKLDLGTNSQTISAWYKTTNSGRQFLVSKGNAAGSNYAYDLEVSSGTIGACVNGSETRAIYVLYATTTNPYLIACGTTDLDDGNWHHLTGTFDKATTTVRLYVDGKLQGSSSSPSGTLVTDSSADFRIGNRADSSGFVVGQLDEVRIYNSALTADQVQLDMNAGAALNINSTAPSEAATLTDGAGNPPAAEWKFDERTGVTANDTSGNGNTGTLTAGPTWATGKIGGALNFDGTDDTVAIASSTTLNSSAATLEAWIKPTEFGTKLIVGRSSSYKLYLGSSGLSLYNAAAVAYAYQDKGTVALNQWNHVVATYDGTTVTAYVNGKLAYSAAYTTSFGTGTNLEIGQDPSGSTQTFSGSIDDVKIYNYARTPSQVAYDYNRGAPIVHWKMNECEGALLNDSISTYSAKIVVGATGTQTSGGTCNTSSTAWGNGASGKFGASLNLDGTDDYAWLDVDNDGVLDTDGGDDHPSFENGAAMTVSAWFKPTNSTLRAIVSRYIDNGSNRGWFLQVNGNLEWTLFTDVSSATASTSNFTLNQWNHAVGVYDGTNMKLYLNGTLVSTTALTGTIKNTSAPLVIGARDSAARFFAGQIDDVRIYNYAVSATQVQQIMNNGAVRFQ